MFVVTGVLGAGSRVSGEQPNAPVITTATVDVRLHWRDCGPFWPEPDEAPPPREGNVFVVTGVLGVGSRVSGEQPNATVTTTATVDDSHHFPHRGAWWTRTAVHC